MGPALIQALRWTEIRISPSDRTKWAPHRGAFFMAGFIVALVCIVSTPALAVDCPADRIDETSSVSRVIDGDTLRLKDGRLIRFIGINTPELGRDGRPDEPQAVEAKHFLESVLQGPTSKNAIAGKTMRVGLRYGSERKDRYGRTLAHVYTSTGESVEARLLSAGMAAYIVVTPNVWNGQCYRAAENQARKHLKGVWSNIYRPLPAAEVPRDARGFRVISGKVVQVGESKRSVWLNFTRSTAAGQHEGVAVRISRKELHYFTDMDPRQLEGKQIVVRGWVYPYKNQTVLPLHHPLALEVVTETPRL
jgi:endonuclease YncB( thermonuclease family)